MGVSGLALTIRSSLESTTFDLANHDASSIQSTFRDAFGTDFPADSGFAVTSGSSETNDGSGGSGGSEGMIRLTFIIGGGKLSRQKYDDKNLPLITSILKECGYVEDRGASCVRECGGSYKTQHDTGKNIKTVVVFPRVAAAGAATAGVGAKPSKKHGGGGGSSGGVEGSGVEEKEPLLPKNSPGYKIALSSLPTFQTLLSTHCPTYLQKKSCLQCLEGLQTVESSLEQKLMHGHPLDAAEKEFYEETTELQEKVACVHGEMGNHVEEGRLTPEERNMLLEKIRQRIVSLEKERKVAPTAALKAGVEEKLEKANTRRQHLVSLTDDVLKLSTYPPPLRYEAQMNQLRKKILPLQALEEASRGRLLTVKETSLLTEKEEMEEEVMRLEEASRGWFEEDEEFERRVRRSRERFDDKFGRKKKASGGKASGGKASGLSGSSGRGTGGGSAWGGTGGGGDKSKWILPGEKPKPQANAWGMSGVFGKKKKARGGAVFSAMMMDSSSEEEDDDDDDDDAESAEEQEQEQDNVGFQVISNAKKTNKASSGYQKNKQNHQNQQWTKVDNQQSKQSKQTKRTKQSDNENPDEADGADTTQSTGKQAQKPKSKGKAKKNKKKKSKKSQSVNDDEDEGDAGDAGDAEDEQLEHREMHDGQDETKERNEQNGQNETSDQAVAKGQPMQDSTLANSLLEFWQSILRPLLSLLLSFFMYLLDAVVGFFFGKKKKKGRGRQHHQHQRQQLHESYEYNTATKAAMQGKKGGKKKKG